MYSTLDQSVLSSASFDAGQPEQIRSLAEFMKTQKGSFPFPIGETMVQFSPAAFGEHLEKLLDSVADGKVVSLSSIVPPRVQGEKDRRFLKPVPKTSAANEMVLAGVSPVYRFENLDWPRKDVIPGASAIVGQMYAGKTHHVREDSGVDIILRYGEPLEDVDYEEGTFQCSDVLDALSKSMVFSALGFRVAIDSFRKLVFSLTGPALTGGIVPAIFDVMTNVNNMFSLAGVHVLVTVNPMLRDDDALNRYYEFMAASTVRAVLLVDKRVASSTARTSKGRVYDVTQGGPDEVLDRSERKEDLEGPHPGFNMQKLPDRSEIDSAAASFGETASSFDEDDDSLLPARQGTNFNL